MTSIRQPPHPILIIAALSVVIFSLTGVAAMMGWLPSSHSEPHAAAQTPTASERQPAPTPAKNAASHAQALLRVAARTTPAPDKPAPTGAKACANCGVVESVHVVEIEGQGSGLGAVAGGVAGGLLGNQIGKGRGNTVATVAGVAGGAYAGHQVEKHMKRTQRYDIIVRMENGSTRTFHQATDPGFASGQKVRIESGSIVRD
jgi:outer membrane lipoprotein SlyB